MPDHQRLLAGALPLRHRRRLAKLKPHLINTPTRALTEWMCNAYEHPDTAAALGDLEQVLGNRLGTQIQLGYLAARYLEVHGQE